VINATFVVSKSTAGHYLCLYWYSILPSWQFAQLALSRLGLVSRKNKDKDKLPFNLEWSGAVELSWTGIFVFCRIRLFSLCWLEVRRDPTNQNLSKKERRIYEAHNILTVACQCLMPWLWSRVWGRRPLPVKGFSSTCTSFNRGQARWAVSKSFIQ